VRPRNSGTPRRSWHRGRFVRHGAGAAAIAAHENELLSAAEELAGVGSFDWDIAAERVVWSQGMNRIRGMERRGAVTVEEAFGGLHPDDEERTRGVMATAIGGADVLVQDRYRIVQPSGAVRRVETRARIERDRSGRAIRVVGVTVDLTDRLAAIEAQAAVERQLREATEAVIEASSEAFIASDEHGVITGWNHQAETLLGWSHDEVVGRSIVDTITPPALRATRQADLDRFRSTGTGRLLTRRSEVSMMHRSGREIPVELAVWPTCLGRETTFNLFAHDITDRQRAQHELGIARDQAIEASRLKSAFLANMSHEIRTPMNGVIGMTELLLDTDLTGPQLQYAEVINSSGEALLTIIDQILDFSKIEAGKLELDNAEFEPHEMVTGVCEMLASPAYAKGIELPLFVTDDVPARAIGDAGRLRQVLVNLVGNAVKFTDTGEVAVTVCGAGDGMVEFAVADTGPGIDQAQRESLFESFSQADASTTRRFGGTGLGLPISRQLVRLMGGEITVESQLGQGSTFRFTVALGAADAESNGERAPRTPSGLRVLVISGNATHRRIVGSYLDALDAEVAAATSGEGALGALGAAAGHAAPFQLIVLDDRLPDMSGTALATIVRSDPQLDGTAIMLLSSAGSPPPVTGALERCTNISKPIRRARLAEAIAQLIGDRPSPSAKPAAAPQPAPMQAPMQAPTRILLAEDNPVNRLVAIQMLTKRGHRVDAAQNGREALELLDAGSYDLVLMDCQMPEMDGYQATAEIRRRAADRAGARVPVVALTANSMPGERETCLAAGMDDYLSKPFRRHQLDAILQRWIPGRPAGTPLSPP
jgi:two-component system sensor histidine kinase/response regulator